MPAKKSPAVRALGDAMRAARLARGYNQETFARDAGFERSNYGAIERGEFNVRLDTIVKLAAGLGLSVAEVMRQAKL
jgi:transcriptional regulator with XRE-family HTH domain